MAKSNRKPIARKAQSPKPIVSVPGEGISVSMALGPFPQTASLKVVCAKSILKAVMAAEDSTAVMNANYDIHWPISLAIELLEQADQQIHSGRGLK